MSRRDPYSTPARRRRIIAEVAKKTLKLYCIQACDNVIWIRQHTAAALTLQCAFRTYQAKMRASILRRRKRHKASVRIQTRIRIKLAQRSVARLRAALHLRRQIRLSQVVNNLRNARKNRMAWLAFMVAKKIAREKREIRAAIDMERVFRGHTGRKIYRRVLQVHLERIKNRNAAAVVLQSHMRRYLAVKSYRYWSARRRSARTIFRVVMRWWSARRRRRCIAAIRIQSILRGHAGRIRASRLQADRAAERERGLQRESLHLQALLLGEVVQELVQLTVASLMPLEQCMNIHVDVSNALLQRMGTQGPQYVVEWCLQNSIVAYSRGAGYQAGAVVQQVVSSVEVALSETQMSDQVSNQGAVDEEKVIALSRWDEGEIADCPHPDTLPTQWTQVVRAATQQLENSVPFGAALSVEMLSGRSVQLHIVALHETTNLMQTTSFVRNVITIVFNSSLDASDIANSDVSDLKFRFKNALVFVDTPKPPVVDEPVIIVEDDGSDSDEEVVEVVRAVEELRPRPSTAVVRIVLRDPTPPPPPVDYDAKAVTLQMLLRRKYQFIVRNARRIQRMVRRARAIYAWQEAVYSVLEIAHDAATIVQCWLRRAAAQRLLQRLKDEYERAHFVFGHDFTLSEEANWAAFGLPLLPVTGSATNERGSCDGNTAELLDALYRNPLVYVPVSACVDDHINGNGGSVTGSQEARRLLQLMRAPAAAEVLGLIDYPAPPPGCLQVPYTGNEGNLPQCVLAVSRLSDRVFRSPLATTKDNPSQRSAEETIFSHTGCMHSQSVRRFISNSTPQVYEVEAPLLSEVEHLHWRQNNLGDFTVDTTALTTLESADPRLLSGMIDWDDHYNVCNALQQENLVQTSPIYAQLARRFQ